MEANTARVADFSEVVTSAASKEPMQPDYQSAAMWAGYVLMADERGVSSDLWHAYNSLHAALGLGPMDWTGPALLTAQAISLPRTLGFLLRGIGAADILRHVADADRTMRRLRVTAFRDMEQTAAALTNAIADHADDQSTDGLEDQSSRVARLYELRQRIHAEKRVLFGQFVVVRNQSFPVTLETETTDSGVDHTTVHTHAECPNCEDTDWSYSRDPRTDIEQIVCQCGYVLNVGGR